MARGIEELEGTSKSDFEKGNYICPFTHTTCTQDKCSHFTRHKRATYWLDDFYKTAVFSDGASCHAGTSMSLWSIVNRKPVIYKPKTKPTFWDKILGRQDLVKYDEDKIFKKLEEAT